MGKSQIKKQIRRSYAEYRRGKAPKATDFLAELKKSMHRHESKKSR